jgi:hypothetical protein
MARELFMGARRNLRLDVLFSEVHERIAGTQVDLGENLYELISGTFNEDEAAVICSKLGFDQMNIGLDANGLIGWNHDDFHKRQKAELIQNTAVAQGKYNLLLDEMAKLRQMNLTPFRVSKFGTAEPQPERNEGVAVAGAQPAVNPPPIKNEAGNIVYHIYGDHIVGSKVGGDQIGGDKVGGDKVGGDQFKDIDASGNTDSAIVFGREGEASVTIEQPENREELLALIRQINQELIDLKSELYARDAEEVAETLEEVEQELQTEEPNAGWIARKLKNVSEIVETVTAATQVASNVALAVQAVQALFG